MTMAKLHSVAQDIFQVAAVHLTLKKLVANR